MDTVSPLTLPPGVWLDEVDSTNSEARRRLEAGEFEGTGFVVADHQTAGRGTRGRVWQSPKDAGIYLSLVHQATPDDPLTLTTHYTLAAGVAAVEAIEQLTGMQPQLKPVNDVMWQGKKLGGILVEADSCKGDMQWVITGVGINWHSPTFEVPEHTPVGIEDLCEPELFAQLSKDTFIELLVGKLCFWHSLVKQGSSHSGQVERAWHKYKQAD